MKLLSRTPETRPATRNQPVLRRGDGTMHALPVHEWVADATALERSVLAGVIGPVIDLGCGPGRLVAALGERGVPALGVDTSPAALTLARLRGAAVLERSIFDPLPGAGRWNTTILLDGNVGIGGDAPRLLRRAAELLAPGGSTLVEVEPPGTETEVHQVRVESGVQRSAWFPWAVVGADGIGAVAAAAGLRVADLWSTGGRWFARLAAPLTS